MRRRRRRSGYRYRLYRFFRDRVPAPRRPRYRVVDRKRFLAAQAVLAAVAVGALALSASVIVRSARTAALNRKLVEIHPVTGDAPEAEIAAPPIEAAPRPAGAASAIGEMSSMTMPDGSKIPAAAAVKTTRFHRTDLDILPDMLALTRVNADTVGWISIAGVVHLPVVYRDNAYYLDHDFTGAKNASGALFLDENSPIAARTQNLLIHGHSMNDGSMFGILTHYRKLSFLKRHPLISFSTLWEKERYAVFAVLSVSSGAQDGDYFNYFDYPAFPTAADFNAYIRQLTERSMYVIPVDVKPSDALLTLSTCLDDDRLVVVARRLRDGETQDELVSAVEESRRAEARSTERS